MNARFRAMPRTLLRAPDRRRSAATVELFGWPIPLEGLVILFAPDIVISLLHIPPLAEQAENQLPLAGFLWTCTVWRQEGA